MVNPANSPSADRRRTQRRRSLLTAKLATRDASLTIDCVIRNLSPEGALVETTSPHLIPHELHLMQVREGIVWDAGIIWRNGNRIGLVLGERHDLRETTALQLRALRNIWTHLTAH
jgi:hypothetical protein